MHKRRKLPDRDGNSWSEEHGIPSKTGAASGTAARNRAGDSNELVIGSIASPKVRDYSNPRQELTLQRSLPAVKIRGCRNSRTDLGARERIANKYIPAGRDLRLRYPCYQENSE